MLQRSVLLLCVVSSWSVNVPVDSGLDQHQFTREPSGIDVVPAQRYEAANEVRSVVASIVHRLGGVSQCLVHHGEGGPLRSPG